MKHKCGVCGNEFELGPNTLPSCPECVRGRMVHPNGISFKHTVSGATAAGEGTSFIANESQGRAIFDYVAYGPHLLESGCKLFYSTEYGSHVAVSFKPLGEIPGSGVDRAGVHASEFATLVDLEGKSKQGPHWMFTTQAKIDGYLSRGDWKDNPKCAVCGVVPVWVAGGVCLNCRP